MKLLNKSILLFENIIVFSIFSGLLAIASLSLISLSPVSLEDYSSYLATTRQTGSEAGTVAGIYDAPVNSGVRFENLLEGQGYTYDLLDNDGQLSLNMSVAFDPSAPTKIEMLAITNSSERKVTYQIVFKFTGSTKTKNALAAGPYLIAKESAPDIYQLNLPAGERVVVSLIRDVNNSFDWYELRKEYDIQVNISTETSSVLKNLP